jgi:hypothetical protein
LPGRPPSATNLSFASERLVEKLGFSDALLREVCADKRAPLLAGNREIERHHRNVGAHRPCKRRGDGGRRVRNTEKPIDLLRDKILDVVHLLGDVSLTVDDDEVGDLRVLRRLLAQRGHAFGPPGVARKAVAYPDAQLARALELGAGRDLFRPRHRGAGNVGLSERAAAGEPRGGEPRAHLQGRASAHHGLIESQHAFLSLAFYCGQLACKTNR